MPQKGPSWGQWGPIGSNKMVKNVKNYHAPNLNFWQKIEVTVMAPNHGGDPLGSILGPMGSYWVKKWVKNIKNYHAPNSNFWLLRGRRFLAKNGSYGYGAKSRWGPLGSILGPMESHWVQKMGQNRKKLPCLKIRILSIPVIDFSQKNRSYRYGAKLRWGPLGSILGPMGSHWVQKMGQNRTKLPSPKI